MPRKADLEPSYVVGTAGAGRRFSGGRYRRSQAAAVPFSPLDIADLRLWLKADALALNNDDPVATWPDSSGNGFDFAQATGAKQPLYKAAIVNGLPVVRFDGTDDLLVRSAIDISSATEGTIIVVAFRSEVAGSPILVASSDVGTATSYCMVDYSTSRIRCVQQNAADTADVVRSGTGVIAVSTWYILVFKSTGSAYTAWRNGTSISLTASAGADTGDWFGDTTLRDNFSVGARKQNTENFFMAGDIAEVLIYDRGLTNLERDALETYLGTKYAITVA